MYVEDEYRQTIKTDNRKIKTNGQKHKYNLTQLQKCKTKLRYHFYLDLQSEKKCIKLSN